MVGTKKVEPERCCQWVREGELVVYPRHRLRLTELGSPWTRQPADHKREEAHQGRTAVFQQRRIRSRKEKGRTFATDQRVLGASSKAHQLLTALRLICLLGEGRGHRSG